jgi:hypothetical protein
MGADHVLGAVDAGDGERHLHDVHGIAALAIACAAGAYAAGSTFPPG